MTFLATLLLALICVPATLLATIIGDWIEKRTTPMMERAASRILKVRDE